MAHFRRTDFDNSTSGNHLVIVPTVWEYLAVLTGLRSNRKIVQRKLISPQHLKRCGMGPSKSLRMSQSLEKHCINELTLLGVCGALVPELDIGDVVCANSTWVQAESQQAGLIDTPLSATMQSAMHTKRDRFKIYYGTMACSTTVVIDSQKRELADISGGIAVEMEAGPLAQWAADAAIPFNHIRVVIDRCNSQPLFFGRPWSIITELNGLPKIRESIRALNTLARLAHELASFRSE